MPPEQAGVSVCFSFPLLGWFQEASKRQTTVFWEGGPPKNTPKQVATCNL